MWLSSNSNATKQSINAVLTKFIKSYLGVPYHASNSITHYLSNTQPLMQTLELMALSCSHNFIFPKELDGYSISFLKATEPMHITSFRTFRLSSGVVECSMRYRGTFSFGKNYVGKSLTSITICFALVRNFTALIGRGAFVLAVETIWGTTTNMFAPISALLYKPPSRSTHCYLMYHHLQLLYEYSSMHSCTVHTTMIPSMTTLCREIKLLLLLLLNKYKTCILIITNI